MEIRKINVDIVAFQNEGIKSLLNRYFKEIGLLPEYGVRTYSLAGLSFENSLSDTKPNLVFVNVDDINNLYSIQDLRADAKKSDLPFFIGMSSLISEHNLIKSGYDASLPTIFNLRNLQNVLSNLKLDINALPKAKTKEIEDHEEFNLNVNSKYSSKFKYSWKNNKTTANNEVQDKDKENDEKVSKTNSTSNTVSNRSKDEFFANNQDSNEHNYSKSSNKSTHHDKVYPATVTANPVSTPNASNNSFKETAKQNNIKQEKYSRTDVKQEAINSNVNKVNKNTNSNSSKQSNKQEIKNNETKIKENEAKNVIKPEPIASKPESDIKQGSMNLNFNSVLNDNDPEDTIGLNDPDDFNNSSEIKSEKKKETKQDKDNKSKESDDISFTRNDNVVPTMPSNNNTPNATSPSGLTPDENTDTKSVQNGWADTDSDDNVPISFDNDIDNDDDDLITGVDNTNSNYMNS